MSYTLKSIYGCFAQYLLLHGQRYWHRPSYLRGSKSDSFRGKGMSCILLLGQMPPHLWRWSSTGAERNRQKIAIRDYISLFSAAPFQLYVLGCWSWPDKGSLDDIRNGSYLVLAVRPGLQVAALLIGYRKTMPNSKTLGEPIRVWHSIHRAKFITSPLFSFNSLPSSGFLPCISKILYVCITHVVVLMSLLERE